jgi:hypothetical protein
MEYEISTSGGKGRNTSYDITRASARLTRIEILDEHHLETPYGVDIWV